MDDLLKLDEETQRRLVLQAAKSISADALKNLRSKQPALRDLDAEISQYFWLCFVGGFFFFFPWLVLPFVTVPLIRVRNNVRKSWRTLLTRPDPECEHLVVAGSVRRLLQKMPRSFRKQKREIARELNRICSHWADLQARASRLEAAYAGIGATSLDARRGELAARIELETDPVVRGSLQKQLQSVEGQRGAHENLSVWRERLKAAQDESMQGLLLLRSRLTLAATAGGIAEAATMTEVSTTLQQINTRLTSTQDAVEEVLRITT